MEFCAGWVAILEPTRNCRDAGSSTDRQIASGRDATESAELDTEGAPNRTGEEDIHSDVDRMARPTIANRPPEPKSDSTRLVFRVGHSS